MQMKLEGDRWTCSGSIAPGTPDVTELSNQHITSIAVSPGTGGSVLVETTCSPLNDIRSGTAIWVPWTSGSVSVKTAEAFVATLSGVRITASAAACLAAIAQ